MRAELRKSGGIGGIRLPPVIVDSTDLAPGDSSELVRLAGALRSAAPVGDSGPGRVRDGMAYTIVLSDGAQFTATQVDGTMSPEFTALLHWLEAHAA